MLCFRVTIQKVMAFPGLDDGDPELKTDEALSSLTDFVTDVIIQLSDATDDNRILSFSNDTGWRKFFAL